MIEAVRCLGTGLMHIFSKSPLQATQAGQSPGYDNEVSIYSHYSVDISTTALSCSHNMQYHKLFHGTGSVNACYCMGARAM